MPGKASQIDVETVRAACAVLGITPGGGGGPDLSAEVAQLQADVAALQASLTPIQSDVATLQNEMVQVQGDTGDLQGRMVVVEDGLGGLPVDGFIYSWVSFDGTVDPPEQGRGYQVANVERLSAGVFRITASVDWLDATAFGVLATSNGAVSPVEVARTSNSVDIDCGGIAGDVSHITVAFLGTVPPEPD